jgi:CheY-like chemotaxis protein
MEKKRILIADDEKAMRVMLAEALKIDDHEIDIVKNGNEAISLFNRKTYDLVITDYMMPGMDGLELIRRIKSRQPATPILIITASSHTQDLLASGAAACIKKPFELMDMRNMVRSMLSNK